MDSASSGDKVIIKILKFFHRMLPPRLKPARIAKSRFTKWSNNTIQSGPFKGMRYVSESICSIILPKLAGSYEKELHPVLEEIRALKPDVVLDIGAAEGYYAVGCLFANISEKVVAFETEEKGRELMVHLMDLNQIDRDRLTIEGICTFANLRSTISRHKSCAIIMDVEGYEALLLDPVTIPELSRVHVVVEMHDFVLKGLTDVICERMKATHKVHVINEQERSLADFSCDDRIFSLMPGFSRLRVICEHRPVRMQWIWLVPRNPVQPREEGGSVASAGTSLVNAA